MRRLLYVGGFLLSACGPPSRWSRLPAAAPPVGSAEEMRSFWDGHGGTWDVPRVRWTSGDPSDGCSPWAWRRDSGDCVLGETSLWKDDPRDTEVMVSADPDQWRKDLDHELYHVILAGPMAACDPDDGHTRPEWRLWGIL